MTLKEELEILRGEPIQVWEVDPMDIPCIETSDSELLCKHPAVSVHMITYNHEPYIREAIEGVMMQKTDFEFELVIGEDCSQDKTREICFELQKKYPDKIRVLWWHENVSKLGGNGRRVSAHCRGEFIAICEGDDYWIDPLKLQKQVDVMRRHPNVGLCFGDSLVTKMDGDEKKRWHSSSFTKGLMNGREFFKLHCFGDPRSKWSGSEWFIMTQTVMCRRSVLREAGQKYEIFKWGLALGDTTTWLALSSISDVYYLADELAVYRRLSSGAIGSRGARVHWDAYIVRFYYTVASHGASFNDAMKRWGDELAMCHINELKYWSLGRQIRKAWQIAQDPILRRLWISSAAFPAWMLASIGLLNRLTASLPLRLIKVVHRRVLL